ncbi:MAG: flagellar basal body P-ring formation chaperone FlgA [Alphaproteobacteria bacterium]
MMRKTRRTSRLKIRESALALCALLALGFGAAGFAQNLSAVSLKHHSIIEGNVITLGDIFSGLDRKADKVLGPAPRPGHDMTLNARTLMRIAVAMDLPWRPASGGEYTVLSRAASVVSPAMVQEALKAELGANGLSGKFNVALTSGDGEIILPPSEDKSVEVESLSFNGDRNRFEATLVAPSKDNVIVREKVRGSVQRLTTLPVLRGTIQNGDIIGMDDLDFIDMRSEFIQHDMVMDADALIGMTARRILHAGEPVKSNEVQPPQIVKRGELITMVFKNGALSLTAKGKALESGARGEMIRVVNTDSSKTLQARVTGQKEVAVQSF